MNTGLAAADAANQPDALQHLRQLRQIGRAQLDRGEFQALAFHHLVGIEEIRLFDTDPIATRKLMDNLGHTALRLTACASFAAAVRKADIVTMVTADKTHATILTPDLIEPGMHINGVGGDCPGKGQRMSLIPELRDPKDLFSLVRPDWSALAPAGPPAARVSAVAGAHIKELALAP